VSFPPGARNPFAVGQVPELSAVVVVLMPLCAAAALASLVVRLRRARATERRQVQVILLAAVLVAVLLGLGQLVGRASPVLVALAMLPLPVATAIAVVRHGLWDLDVVVRRGLIWGVLSTAVVACYVLVVEGVGAALGERRGAALVATGLVAVGVLPVRARVQRAVNRLLYGLRDDPESVLARLGARLEETVSADDVLPGIAQTVAGALRLPYVAVHVTGYGAGVAGTPGALAPLRLPLVHAGEVVGELEAAPRDADGFGRGDRAALERLAGQVAVAAHAVRLAGELQRSRERLVLAREEERRRLRRDLHDELGPTLAALALELDDVRDLARDDPELGPRLERLAARARAGVGDVRRLAHDLRPPALDDLGLVGALRQLTARAGIPVEISADLSGPLPAAVEVAAYRIILEALANVSRHADATHAEVVLERSARTLLVAVRDDGRGIAPGAREGVGLRSLRERAAELGGTAHVGPAAGGGTEIRASLPLEAP
jgi:signal transduction histidine kinase